MKEATQEAASLSYYLPLQIAASGLMALLALLLGLFLAWIIWGGSKRRVAKLLAETSKR